MRPPLGQAQERAGASLAPETRTPTTLLKEIPYDHVATFTLTGLRGNRIQDVLNISIDGAFVAVSIGYSLLAPGNLVVEPTIDGVGGLEPFLPVLARALLTRFVGVEFKYSLVDSGTGRELQNKPIHNLAGLGEATGERPFRTLAKPMLFLPRSTIRIEVEEISQGLPFSGAQLFIVLQGYKILGYGTALP